MPEHKHAAEPGGGSHHRAILLPGGKSIVRDNDDYDTFQCWRYPKPRQVWVDGKSTAPHHRPSSNNDLILDLALVIVLANIGTNFRANVASVPTGCVRGCVGCAG